MKSPNTIDRRIVVQTLTLCTLIVLPTLMISRHGPSTLRSIFGSLPGQASANEVLPSTRAGVSSKSEPVLFGAYDPAGLYENYSHLAIRHTYLSWVNFDAESMRQQIAAWRKQGHRPMVTVEPWPREGESETLMQDIVAGKYDAQIDQVISLIDESGPQVYLSWGHEMDQDLTKRYPWSGVDPKMYIAAYRHVVDRVRESTTAEVRWVWTGVLKEGSLHYWPGDSYVDFIGLPVYSFPQWDRQTYGYIRDFRTTLEEKRRHVRTLHKPLMITELGVSGSDDFQQFWLHQAFLALDDYDDLAAVVFFQAPETEGVWGKGVETPNWSANPDLIRGLVDWKLQSQRAR